MSTYTERYPSGKPYTACGAAHPSTEPDRRCSQHADHEGRHMNRRGNEWESPTTRTYRITHTYELEASTDEAAQQLGDNLAKSMHYVLDAADVTGSWYPTTTVEEIELAKCRTLHGDENEVIECWQERAREARPIALLQD